MISNGPRSETAKSPSWLAGYRAGYANLSASMVVSPVDWRDFNVGYAVGIRARSNDALIDEMEKAIGDE